jgi:hypothetical protein
MVSLVEYICTKVWDPSNMSSLREGVAITMSLIELQLQEVFFDIMTHLTLHVVEELNICGLVHSRWMYPIENAMKVFKGYICNKARLKASMAEGYIYNETIRFVNKYMVEFKHVRTQVWDANEEEGVCGELLEGKGQHLTLIARQKIWPIRMC